MAITVTAQPANVPPRVQISITGLSDLTTNVLRLDPDGRTRPVRTAEPATLSGGGWLGYDYEMPLGVPVTYSFTPATTPNLLTTNQAGLETNTTGWAAVGGTNSTIARVTTAFREGVASLSVGNTIGGTAYASTPRNTTGMPVIVGESYTVSAWFRASTSSKSVAVAIVWLNSGGTQIGSTLYSAGVPDTTTDWTQVTLTATAPATTAYAAITVVVYGAVVGEPHYADSISFTQVAGGSTVTVTTTDGWLVNPGVPDLSMRLDRMHVTQLEDRVRGARAAVHQPLGRNTPVVVSETRSSVQAGITVLTDTLADRDTLLGVVDTGAVLLLNLPAAWEWGVTWEYVSVGDVAEAYVGGGADDPGRLFSLPYTVVDRPIGALQAQWTITGVLTEYATINDVMAAFDTCSDLLANSPN